ncbi:hypothetical protein IC229_23835 [Spirosoma sp. BT702]|uniref:LamG domain-containing protein n=1 Tax=Spirosoma profusum TaxID=2771354 RepID=A0A926Y355_9BACT|nr:LamG-like jellyroll fold domain-containing protein [Spirosoma profusum]MBD2703697.1 hypothetical protein [Spirosoma profusum]
MKTKQITAWVAAAAVMSTVFTSCKKDDGTATLPDIGGYQSSNDIASANLLARWTFEGTQNELVSSTAPSNTYGTVNYVTGSSGSGQALNLVTGAVVYPAIPKLNAADALASYTLSMWVNVKNNKQFFTSFFGLFPTAKKDAFGNLSGGAETGWFAASATPDTLVLKANYSSLLANGNFNGQDNRPDPRGKPPVGVFKGAGVWSHFVIRFDPNTHQINVFGNGQSIGAYNDRGVNTVALNMMTPCQAVIGSLASSEIGFAAAGPLPSYTTRGTFAIDNIRVYNKPLSDGDINSLYQLELAGR